MVRVIVHAHRRHGCLPRENLQRLLEDKHFKEEIVHFNISAEGEVVDALHRDTLIPLLMRSVCLPACLSVCLPACLPVCLQ